MRAQIQPGVSFFSPRLAAMTPRMRYLSMVTQSRENEPQPEDEGGRDVVQREQAAEDPRSTPRTAGR